MFGAKEVLCWQAIFLYGIVRVGSLESPYTPTWYMHMYIYVYYYLYLWVRI